MNEVRIDAKKPEIKYELRSDTEIYLQDILYELKI